MPQQLVFVTVADNGRAVIPVAMREQLGIRGGEKLLARVVDGEIVLTPREAALRRARELVGKYVPADVDLVAEFIADRRAESERE